MSLIFFQQAGCPAKRQPAALFPAGGAEGPGDASHGRMTATVSLRGAISRLPH